MTLVVDQDKCVGCGICVNACPHVFYMDKDGNATTKEFQADCDLDFVKDQCPTEAIYYKTEKLKPTKDF